MRRIGICQLAWLLVLGAVHAQDTRKVTEPVVPPVCAVLIAKLSAPVSSPNGDDTARIQQAINVCGQGHAVRLAQGNGHQAYRSSPLQLKSGVTLLIDAGVTLYATTDPAAYDRGSKSCGTNDLSGKGCKPFITAENTEGSGIMGEGVIDGQGGRVIDNQAESWWQLARRAQKEGKKQNVPRLIEVTSAGNFTLYRITLRNAANFHVTLSRVDGFTAWGIKIDAPKDARNTDGIDPIASRNITIAESFIRTGDDNIAIKAGRAGRSENISILSNHFYNGHGMSIGSETEGGVGNVLVENLTMDGATSGLRIKSDVSRGGLVENVRYRHVCLRNVRTPIDLDTRYDPRAAGNKIPVYKSVSFEHVQSLTPGRVVMRGLDADHKLGVHLNNVEIDGARPITATHADLTWGESPASNRAACESRFVDFPADKRIAVRPQLSPDQASRYSPTEVLKTVGIGAKERLDPWDPLADPLATGAALKADYTVDQTAVADGRTIFNSVQAAVNRAVIDSNTRTARQFILVKPGVYRELLYVPAATAPITLFGSDSDATKTRIVANLHAGTSGDSYTKKFGAQFAGVDKSIADMYVSLKDRPTVSTPGSAIAWIRNHGFQARNITFENAWNRGEVAETVPAEILAQHVQTFNQAVALMVDGADKVQFENVRFLGFQDTLFLNTAVPGTTVRSFFNKSYVEGDTDFIFGDATAYFYQSEIKSLGARKSLSYVAAPSTNIGSRFGFVFNQSKFTHDGTANALAGNFKFARQWFRGQKCTPYGVVTMPTDYACRLAANDRYDAPTGTISKGVLETVGKVIILNSVIGVHIDKAKPWADWNAAGTIKHRPAQHSSDEFWSNLVAAGIDPIRHLAYAGKPTNDEPFLGEFNNKDE